MVSVTNIKSPDGQPPAIKSPNGQPPAYLELETASISPPPYINHDPLYQTTTFIGKEVIQRAITIMSNVQKRLPQGCVHTAENQQFLQGISGKLFSDGNATVIKNCIYPIVKELIQSLEKQNNSSDYPAIATNIRNKTNMNPSQNEIIKKMLAAVVKLAKDETANETLTKLIDQEINNFLNDEKLIKDLSKVILEALGFSYINSHTSCKNGDNVTNFDQMMHQLVLYPARFSTKEEIKNKHISSDILAPDLKPITRKILTILMTFISTITFLSGLAIGVAAIVVPIVLTSPLIGVIAVICSPVILTIVYLVCFGGVSGYDIAIGLGTNTLDLTLHDTIRTEISQMLLVLLDKSEVKNNPDINYQQLAKDINNIFSDTNGTLKKIYSDFIANQKVFLKNMNDVIHAKDDFDQSKQEEYKKKNMQQAENMINAILMTLAEHITDKTTKEILLKAKGKYLADLDILNFYRHIFTPTILGALRKINSDDKLQKRINQVDQTNQEIFQSVIRKELELYQTFHLGIEDAITVKSE